MDMSHRENNYFLSCIFCLVFLSCNNDEKRIQRQRELYVKESVKIVGVTDYYKVYDQAKDTIEFGMANGLFKMQKYALDWQLDSLICFNQNATKCVMSIMNQQSETVSNSINHFYGFKINQDWYFFRGATLYAFSDFYGLPPKVPLSFEKLEQIATQNIYRGYLKKGKQGQWEINEHFFDQVIPQDGTIEFYGLKNEEEFVKWLVGMNWAARDTTNNF